MSAIERINVVLVDAQEIVRHGLQSLLENEGDFEVIAETDKGPAAIALAKTYRPHVVVMDILPDGSGIEACRAIRAECPGTQVVMLTSFADDKALFDAIMAGAAGFLLKEARGPELIDAIRTVAEGRSLLDPSVTKRVLERLRQPKLDETDRKLGLLSAQEERILDMIGEGLTNREIAARIHLSDKTVKNYVSSILEKLEVGRRAEAASYVATARARQRGGTRGDR